MTKSVDELLADARARLRRLSPSAAAEVVALGGLLIDTRPAEQRARDGIVPEALIVDRNVLEWRLDPSSPHRIDAITDHRHAIIVMCDEGYSSSLVAAQLQDMGFADATDVIGGYQAWRDAGLPTTRES